MQVLRKCTIYTAAFTDTKGKWRSKNRLSLPLLTLLLLGQSLATQSQPLADTQKTAAQAALSGQKDTVSLISALSQGRFLVHFRQFNMATLNKAENPDYYAIAGGMGLRYETGTFKHFQLAAGGYFHYNLASSDLAAKDARTGTMNRYEVGLFDIENPSNRTHINRLEELYLKYRHKDVEVTWGKQLINSHFVNQQDGRMRPTVADGLWSAWQPSKSWQLRAGWLYKISPRSTTHWFNTGQSIGVYPQGVNTDGTKGNYGESLRSKGIAIASVKYSPHKQFSVELFDQWVENIFNTVLVEATGHIPMGKQSLHGGFMYITQQRLNNGGSADAGKAYFEEGNKSNTLSATVALDGKRWKTAVSYTRIFAGGRYLMPREWGKDPFYTFMPRERNEGMGDVHAWMAKLTRPWTKEKNLLTSLGLGYFQLPDVLDYQHNKYGLPSYLQANLDLRYQFSGSLKHMSTTLLLAGKLNQGELYNNPRYEVNKVNMLSASLIFNYHI